MRFESPHCRADIVCCLLFLAVGVNHVAGAEQMSIEEIIRQHGKEAVTPNTSIEGSVKGLAPLSAPHVKR